MPYGSSNEGQQGTVWYVDGGGGLVGRVVEVAVVAVCGGCWVGSSAWWTELEVRQQGILVASTYSSG